MRKTAAKQPTTPLPSALCPLPFVHVLRVAALSLIIGLSAACRQDMHDAPRYDPLEAAPILARQSSAQPLVAGTVPRGFDLADAHLHTGKDGNVPVATFPFPITRADLDRGEERFNIYCTPCHGRTGEGNGMVVQRGFKQPPSYHIDRLREMPAGYFFDVMTNGFGAMPDYRAQVSVEDRWRIVAYVKALQLSHSATAADVPADEMRKLNEGGGAGAPAPAAATPGRGGHEE